MIIANSNLDYYLALHRLHPSTTFDPANRKFTSDTSRLKILEHTTSYVAFSAFLVSNNVVHAVIRFTIASETSTFPILIRYIHSQYPS